MVSFLAEVKVSIFGPKTMDYNPWFDFWSPKKVGLISFSLSGAVPPPRPHFWQSCFLAVFDHVSKQQSTLGDELRLEAHQGRIQNRSTGMETRRNVMIGMRHVRTDGRTMPHLQLFSLILFNTS